MVIYASRDSGSCTLYRVGSDPCELSFRHPARRGSTRIKLTPASRACYGVLIQQAEQQKSFFSGMGV
jgi:hypothetical protein